MANNQEPLIKLQQGGIAPIISYNIPEPTSYCGRNFIDLQIPDSYFIPPSSTGSLSQPDQSNQDDLGGSPGMIKSGEMLGLEDNWGLPEELLLNPELPKIDPEEVKHMAQAGKKLVIYRTLYGYLTYKYIDNSLTVGLDLPAGQIPDSGKQTLNSLNPSEPIGPSGDDIDRDLIDPNPVVMVVEIFWFSVSLCEPR